MIPAQKLFSRPNRTTSPKFSSASEDPLPESSAQLAIVLRAGSMIHAPSYTALAFPPASRSSIPIPENPGLWRKETASLWQMPVGLLKTSTCSSPQPREVRIKSLPSAFLLLLRRLLEAGSPLRTNQNGLTVHAGQAMAGPYSIFRRGTASAAFGAGISNRNQARRKDRRLP